MTKLIFLYFVVKCVHLIFSKKCDFLTCVRGRMLETFIICGL